MFKISLVEAFMTLHISLDLALSSTPSSRHSDTFPSELAVHCLDILCPREVISDP
jgi:hypothetical protein